MSEVSRMSGAGSFFTDPALKRVRMRLFTVVVVVFTLVCSGSFGMEDVVSSSGPGFTILLICLLPFFWSVPMAFISSELGSAIPEEGGFGRWCRRGLGEYWGFQTSWWWTLSLYVDSAVYITLALGYIQSKWGMSDNWRWMLGIGLVAFFTFINIRGLDLTGKSLIVVQAVVMVPFVLFVFWAFAKGTGNPVSPFLPKGETIFSATNLGLAIMMWMYSGYESMSTVAAEVENPQRVIPRAILIAVPIVIVTYALTTMAGIRAAGSGNWLNMVSDASGGGGAVDFVKAASIVGGGFLMWLMLASAIASNLGLYTGLPGDRSTALVPALARPPLSALHGPRAQALGHALDRHPHHGRGRRRPRQGQLHDAHRDRRVPAHVQLHPDLHRGHRRCASASRTCRGPTACRSPRGCSGCGCARRSPSPSTRSSPTAATTWSAASSAWSAARSPTCS